MRNKNNRTEQNKTKQDVLTLDFYKSLTQEHKVNL